MKQAVLPLPGNHDSGNDRKRITETDKENPVMFSIVFQDQIKIGVTRIDPNIITFIHYKIHRAHREDSYSFIIWDLMENLKDFEKKISFSFYKT